MNVEIKPTCVLQGPIQSRAGYGDHCRQIAIALIKWGKFDVKINPMKWGGCPNSALDSDEDPNNAIIRSALLTENIRQKPELFVQVSIPNEFKPAGHYNIGITAGIETTVPRLEWLEGLNRMDLNIVPSKFSKDVFTAASFTRTHPDGKSERIAVSKPIEVAFEGNIQENSKT